MKQLYIDAMALTDPRMSGIGSALLNTIRALEQDVAIAENYQLNLIVPFNKVGSVRRWKFSDKTRIVRHYFPGKVMNGLIRLNLLPPMDLFVGKGIYIFPNFRNWPLLHSPSLTYVHDVAYQAYPNFIEPRNLVWLRRFVPRWIARANVVATVSEHAKSEILKYFPEAEGKVQVVPNGVDSQLFYPRPTEEQEEIQRKYGIEKPYFMFLSNLEPRKNVEVLLEAFSRVDQAKTMSLLLVGGMGWLNEPILQKIQQLQNQGHSIIRPDSYVPEEDLPALLSGTIALVHPALYEGFGISPLEAMSCGAPVIAASNTSIPEVVGSAGILVGTSDVDGYAQAMRNVNEDKRLASRLSSDGIARAKQFSWKKTAATLAGVIEAKL